MNIDLSPITNLIQRVRDAVDGVFTLLESVRDRISAEVSSTLRSVLPSIAEAIAAALTAFGTLTEGLLENLATPQELVDGLGAAIAGKAAGASAWLSQVADLSWDAFVGLIGRAASAGMPLAGASGLIDAILAGNVSGIAARMRETWDGAGMVGKYILSIVAVGYSAPAILGAMALPSITQAQHDAWQERPTQLVAPAEAALAAHRRYIDWQAYYGIAQRHGLNGDQAGILRAVTEIRPAPQELLRAVQLGLASPETARTGLKRHGYSDGDIGMLEALAEWVPSPMDIVTLAGREAFEDDQAALLGLDAEYDTVDWTLAERAGLHEPWRRYYWRAHWQPVSPIQLLEMYQRGIVSDDQLDAGLKAQEYTPLWREKLRQLSYNVLTRVDTQRMHELGILDRAGVVQSYRDQGYSPDDADRMADFTVMLKLENDRQTLDKLAGRTRTELLDAYRQGTMGRDDAGRLIAGLGYPAEDIAVWLAEADVDRERVRIDALRDALKPLYVNGHISELTLRDRLRDGGIDTREQDWLIEAWRVTRENRDLTEAERRQRDLTRAEVLRAYRERVMGQPEAHRMLMAMGYDEPEAHTLLVLEDAAVARETRDAQEGTVRRLFLAGRINYDDARARLLALRIPGDRVATLLERWQIEIDERTPDLPLSWIEELAREKMLAEEEVEGELTRRGYTPSEVDWMLMLWGYRTMVAEERIRVQREAIASREQMQRERLDLQAALQAQRLSEQEERQLRTLAAQRERDELSRAMQLETLARRLTAQAASEERRARQSQAQLDQRLTAQQAQQERAIQARAELQSQADELRREIADQANAMAARRLETQLAALERRIEAADRQLEQRQAHDVRILGLRDELGREAEVRAEVRRVAQESRQELRQVAKEERQYVRQVQTRADTVMQEAALAAARGEALARVEAQLRAQVDGMIQAMLQRMQSLQAGG